MLSLFDIGFIHSHLLQIYYGLLIAVGLGQECIGWRLNNGRLFELFQLLDLVYREETLLNVIRSVTKNGRSILMTAVLAIILVYFFSIIGLIFFQDDFLMEVNVASALGITNKGYVSLHL